MTTQTPYLVLARKYRPQQFGEMSGQAHVVRTLSNALRSGQLAHAFLFTGPRGVGKTTAARLVAKALNCEKGPTAEPCGVCVPCIEIAEGRSVDVAEIDAASNNGVDNVRDIVEAVKYRPARDRFKVFVVDEVHMLSTGAFNALLKTLEEPPPHVKFVLATTDAHKVPETIVSRCQRFDFRRLTVAEIVDQLSKVARSEGLKLSQGALGLIARSAEGGMRDALSMLDQVRAACGDAPDDQAVAEALGAVDASAISRIGEALVARDGATILAEIDLLHERGLEMKRVAEEIARHLRNVIVAKLVPGSPIDLPDAELVEVRAQAERAEAVQLTRLFDLAQRAVNDVKLAEGSRHALEVALLEGVLLAPGAEVAELVARLEALSHGAPLVSSPRSGGAGGGPGSPREPETRKTSAARPAASGSPGHVPSEPPKAAPAREAGALEAVPDARPSQAVGTSGPAEAGEKERWRGAVAAVERVSPMAAPALKQAALLRLVDGEVAIQLPPGLFAQTAEKRRNEIEGELSRFFGKPTRLEVLVSTTSPKPQAAATESPSSIVEAEAAERLARSSKVREAAKTNENIKEAVRILGGSVEKIEEL